MNEQTCTICSRKHSNQWIDGPNMYCQYCEPLREAARGTMDLIVHHLYLGDMKAASEYGGERLCVHEDGPTYGGEFNFIPILEKKPNSKLDRTGALVMLPAIDLAALLIHSYVSKGKEILVHCHGGIERSPLTVAWYLVHHAKMFNNLSDAYFFIKQRRPVISNRLMWLPKGAA